MPENTLHFGTHVSHTWTTNQWRGNYPPKCAVGFDPEGHVITL